MLLIVLSSLLAVVYVWRFVEAAYFVQPSDEAAPARREAPLSMLLPSMLLVAAIVYFGLDTELTLGSASQAAEALMNGMRR